MKFVESSETSTDSGICNVAAVSMEEFVFTQDIRFNSSSCSGAFNFPGSGDGTRKKSSVAPSDKVKRETEKTETINPTHSLAETANTMLELKDSAHVLQPSNPNEVWFQVLIEFCLLT